MDELIDLAIDVETFYDADYTLKKMTLSSYVLDPRFEIIGLSYKLGDDPIKWITGDFEYVRSELAKLPWDRCRVIAHNARFEAAILEWRLGFVPAVYLCTMVGSRPHLVPYAGGQSLEALLKYTGLGSKGDYVGKAEGIHRDQFTSSQLEEYCAYCINDTEGSYKLGQRLGGILSSEEIEILDSTIKKFVRPTLLLKRGALVNRITDIKAEKQTKLDYLAATYGVGLKDIRSREKFALTLSHALNGTGQTVPRKASKSTGKTTYAFAKDDLEFKALLGHQNQKVRDLVSAKLFFASTLEESRIERLIEMHDLSYLGGRLAVPLVYYGAHTGRFSGDESINLQNLPRVEWTDSTKTTLKKGHLRFCIAAQPGYSIVSADLSNIEARIVATLSGQTDLIEGFRRGEDIYARFASTCYGIKVSKDTHPKERFVGKTCILGLGYGMGWKKFHLKMLQEGVLMSEQEAKRIVYLYRSTYEKIPGLWGDMNYAAEKFLTDPKAIYPWRGLIFAHERIILPNNMPIIYPGIMFSGHGLSFKSRAGKAIAADAYSNAGSGATMINVWGGALTENVAQALARIILTAAELKLARMGIIAALQVHDELVFHIPTILAEKVMKVIAETMTAVVPWMTNLPVAVEISHGPTYGACKQ